VTCSDADNKKPELDELRRRKAAVEATGRKVCSR
jgi:hypothetical protein